MTTTGPDYQGQDQKENCQARSHGKSVCGFDHVKEMRIFQTIGQYFENMGLIKGKRAYEDIWGGCNINYDHQVADE